MRTLRHFLTVAFGLLAGGILCCSQHSGRLDMNTWPADLKKFNVNGAIPGCADWRQSMPAYRDPAAYSIYIKARKLWRSKAEWRLTRQEGLDILRGVQQAAMKGDWGARATLAQFYRIGLGPLPSNHVLDPQPEQAIEIVRTAIAAGQAWGYYDMGVAYEHGYGSVDYDKDLAWAFFRRAAELGSPYAQMALASAYREAKRTDAADAMLMCAYHQGHGPAAHQLGVAAKGSKQFSSALAFYQDGIKFGHKESAGALVVIFDQELWASKPEETKVELLRLGIAPDDERSKRYQEVYDALEINPDLRLSRLTTVLPLPPAELPPWNGVDEAIEPERSAPKY